MKELLDIERKFLSAVKSIGPVESVLLAVSGGADSMAMLSLCLQFLPSLLIPFTVITVNHNIRTEHESASDAAFVISFCKEHSIPCIEKTVKKGYIKSLADIRNKGIEEAARYVRYSFFEETAREINASSIFLAHTKNDQLETILQRFFQGSSSLYGIMQKRNLFFRPLLDVQRTEIEEYLASKSLIFCNDQTNSINTYYRNRLRNTIIPYLNSILPGWDTGILSGAKRASFDADYFESQLQDIWEAEGEDLVSTNYHTFISFHIAIRIRYLYKSLVLLQIDQRVPFSIIETAANGIPCETASISFYQKKDKLFIKKLSSTGKILNFFAIIEGECTIKLPFGTLYVVRKDDSDVLHGQKQYLLNLPCVMKIQQETIKIEQLYGYSSEIAKYVYFIRKYDE